MSGDRKDLLESAMSVSLSPDQIRLKSEILSEVKKLPPFGLAELLKNLRAAYVFQLGIAGSPVDPSSDPLLSKLDSKIDQFNRFNAASGGYYWVGKEAPRDKAIDEIFEDSVFLSSNFCLALNELHYFLLSGPAQSTLIASLPRAAHHSVAAAAGAGLEPKAGAGGPAGHPCSDFKAATSGGSSNPAMAISEAVTKSTKAELLKMLETIANNYAYLQGAGTNFFTPLDAVKRDNKRGKNFKALMVKIDELKVLSESELPAFRTALVEELSQVALGKTGGTNFPKAVRAVFGLGEGDIEKMRDLKALQSTFDALDIDALHQGVKQLMLNVKRDRYTRVQECSTWDISRILRVKTGKYEELNRLIKAYDGFFSGGDSKANGELLRAQITLSFSKIISDALKLYESYNRRQFLFDANYQGAREADGSLLFAEFEQYDNGMFFSDHGRMVTRCFQGIVSFAHRNRLHGLMDLLIEKTTKKELKKELSLIKEAITADQNAAPVASVPQPSAPPAVVDGVPVVSLPVSNTVTAPATNPVLDSLDPVSVQVFDGVPVVSLPVSNTVTAPATNPVLDSLDPVSVQVVDGVPVSSPVSNTVTPPATDPAVESLDPVQVDDDPAPDPAVDPLDPVQVAVTGSDSLPASTTPFAARLSGVDETAAAAAADEAYNAALVDAAEDADAVRLELSLPQAPQGSVSAPVSPTTPFAAADAGGAEGVPAPVSGDPVSVLG